MNITNSHRTNKQIEHTNDKERQIGLEHKAQLTSRKPSSTEFLTIIKTEIASIIQFAMKHYTLSKKDTIVAHYNFNAHQRILVIFGRDVAEKVC